ncbi:MAG: Uma2 family endonuclease [Chloroflexi bacterium]|nr:Uma2 family endonuclease [Chloroflexota bacterium]
MVQPNPRLKFTVKDYMSAPSDKRYQLLDGEMIVAPSPVTKHQDIVVRILLGLTQFVRQHNLGRVFVSPLDVVLSNHDVAQPDILFVSNARSAIITEANIQGAPDLVVEIISPGTAAYDRGYKQALYGRHGVRESWLVDPDAETVEVLTLGEQGLVSLATYRRGDLIASPLLEDLALETDQVFSQS